MKSECRSKEVRTIERGQMGQSSEGEGARAPTRALGARSETFFRSIFAFISVVLGPRRKSAKRNLLWRTRKRRERENVDRHLPDWSERERVNKNKSCIPKLRSICRSTYVRTFYVHLHVDILYTDRFRLGSRVITAKDSSRGAFARTTLTVDP